jgi:hypothetical protein
MRNESVAGTSGTKYDLVDLVLRRTKKIPYSFVMREEVGVQGALDI